MSAAPLPRSCFETLMLLAATPVDERSSDDRTSTEPLPAVVPVFDRRFRPLNWAAPVTALIWLRSAVMSVWILLRSTFDSCDATIFSFIFVRRSVTVSEALVATATVLSPSDSELEIALKPLTSASITFEIAQTAELSFAEAIDLPVEISSWVLVRLELMPLRVCSATMALVLVRMLDMCRVP